MNQNIDDRVIDRFFMRMAAIYPYKWSGQFPNADAVMIAKEEWREGLEDLTLEEIKKGFLNCKLHGPAQFPPTIKEFRTLCLPTKHEMGILHEEEAFKNYCDEKLNSPVLKNTAKILDRYYFNQLTQSEARQYFFRVYRAEVDKFIANYTSDKKLMALENKSNVLQLEKKESSAMRMEINDRTKIGA